MVNLNNIVNYVKARLGASHRALELSDEAIINCIQNETLVTLSIFFPYYCNYLMKLNADNEVMPGMNTYFIPTEIEEFQVLGVEHALPASGNLSNHSYFFMPMGGDLQSIVSMLASTALANNVASYVVNPSTFKFMAPNMVRFNNGFATTDMLLILKTTHKKDFSTFQMGLYETIKELALCDVALDIYSIRKYFTNIQTMFAQINLDIDFFSQFPDKRTTLVEKMRLNQLKSANAKKIYIY